MGSIGHLVLARIDAAEPDVSVPFVLVLSKGVFGRFDLAALRGCHTLNVCLSVCVCMHTDVVV
jgi:hypothetical protein